jgi:hypothetical protein
MDGLIRACIDGKRYSHKWIESLKPVIEKMTSMGAQPNLSDIIRPEFDTSDRKAFEDDAFHVRVKARLLKICTEQLPSEVANATPILWEDMEDENSGPLSWNLSTKYTYHEAYYNAIKYEYDNIDNY